MSTNLSLGNSKGGGTTATMSTSMYRTGASARSIISSNGSVRSRASAGRRRNSHHSASISSAEEDIEAGGDAFYDGDPHMNHSMHRLDPILEQDPSLNLQAPIRPPLPARTFLFCGLIMLLGCGAAGAFIGLGLSDIQREANSQFDRSVSEIVNKIDSTWESYETVTLFVHKDCTGGTTAQQFREAYEYVVSTGLPITSILYTPNVTHSDRSALEFETRAYYAFYDPDFVGNYTGFTGVEPDPNEPNATMVGPRSNQTFYFPTHYIQPPLALERSLDFDLYSDSTILGLTIDQAVESWQPALTPGFLMDPSRPDEYTVVLMHPGIALSTSTDERPGYLANTNVAISDLLREATKSVVVSTTVYIYDSTSNLEQPDFLGGATVLINRDGEIQVMQEKTISLQELRASVSTREREQMVQVANRQWTVAVVAVPGTYQPNDLFVIFGGLVIIAACTFITIWLFTTMRREAIMRHLQNAAEAEKAAITVDNARRAAKTERDLNDFIAHEVRNPLSAALSACSFVSSALTDEGAPLVKPKDKKSILEDVVIVENSLTFINDLLRNMLDMQRAKSNQLKIEWNPTDIKRDVLMPVDSMLYSRGGAFDVEIDCPENLIVTADRMRLKQIMLNLGRNAVKFVERGFIRLRATVISGNVCLCIEDSGPGIPAEKRQQLFAKFQESLDSLNQGTGIGLSLCKKLADLMEAEIWFDETYNSGIQGCPGTRFIINLNRSPLQLDHANLDSFDAEAPQDDIGEGDRKSSVVSETLPGLPSSLSVLFVDDDLVLRKLFVRAVRKVSPQWKVQEAANGETALRLAGEEEFDLIFLDQYMASVEKQLLGTETARALRSKGVTCKICGLSANDTEDAFLDAGANAFMIKPFPCDKESLTKELLRILYCSETTEEMSGGHQKGR